MVSQPHIVELCVNPPSPGRFLGLGMKLTYEQRQGSSVRSLNTDVTLGLLEVLECLFPSDAGSAVPQYTEVPTPLHIPCRFPVEWPQSISG